jgi:hypothetical protein
MMAEALREAARWSGVGVWWFGGKNVKDGGMALVLR